MKIGILGSGMVGKVLSKGFLGLGYEVMTGSRNPSKLEQWHKEMNNPKLSVGTFAETASFGGVVVLATHGTATVDVLNQSGKENFTGKTVIDVTNPLDFSTGKPVFAAALGNSLGEQIQNAIPEAKVVKAFNIVNCNIMINAKMQEGQPDMFIAGNDKDAKDWVGKLALDWGWNSCIDLGGIEESYWLETFAMLWIKFGAANNHWTHAFKLLKK
ncbi:MAG: NAD(P)-binding domain-containing protein [Ignavibacteriaceae bacterium]|nr:NAD(P)-binding domain-containing protein [Ignavibacteriaceae bacterium]